MNKLKLEADAKAAFARLGHVLGPGGTEWYAEHHLVMLFMRCTTCNWVYHYDLNTLDMVGPPEAGSMICKDAIHRNIPITNPKPDSL